MYQAKATLQTTKPAVNQDVIDRAIKRTRKFIETPIKTEDRDSTMRSRLS